MYYMQFWQYSGGGWFRAYCSILPELLVPAKVNEQAKLGFMPPLHVFLGNKRDESTTC